LGTTIKQNIYKVACDTCKHSLYFRYGKTRREGKFTAFIGPYLKATSVFDDLDDNIFTPTKIYGEQVNEPYVNPVEKFKTIFAEYTPDKVDPVYSL
jgi:hypothetical protein